MFLSSGRMYGTNARGEPLTLDTSCSQRTPDRHTGRIITAQLRLSSWPNALANGYARPAPDWRSNWLGGAMPVLSGESIDGQNGTPGQRAYSSPRSSLPLGESAWRAKASAHRMMLSSVYQIRKTRRTRVFFSKVSTQSFRGSEATSEPKVGWTPPTSSAAFFCAVVVPNHFHVHFLASGFSAKIETPLRIALIAQNTAPSSGGISDGQNAKPGRARRVYITARNDHVHGATWTDSRMKVHASKRNMSTPPVARKAARQIIAPELRRIARHLRRRRTA